MSTSSQGSKPSSGWQPPSLEEMQAMLPQYHFEKLLGRGGMGAVYKAVQASLDRAVAIKVLPGDLVGDDDAQFAERFKNEARTMAKMSHPSIVNVFDFGETQTGLLYIVMEFIDGTDVAQMILSQGRLPEDYALSITAHVCDALAYAHQRGVIHRDIKPANILINMEGQVKVADFGLAKQSDPNQSGLTKTNMAMGTPDFVAPEALIPGVPLDGRADLYAIGVMLYNMLTGEIPRGMWAMPAQKVGTDPRFDAIIAKAMQTDREARFQSATDIRRELDTILALPRSVIIAQQQAAAEAAAKATRAQKVAEAAPKPELPPAKPKSMLGPVLSIAATLVLGGGLYWLMSKGSEKIPPPGSMTVAEPAAANSPASAAAATPPPEPPKATEPTSSPPPAAPPATAAVEFAVEEGFVPLFKSEQDISGWTAEGGAPPNKTWSFLGGGIACNVPAAGLWSPEEYADFELRLDWKPAPRGNGAIAYHSGSVEYRDALRMRLCSPQLKPERCGELMDLDLPMAAASVKIEEWNTVRLIVRGSHREHWINEAKVLEYDVTSPAFQRSLKASSSKTPNAHPGIPGTRGHLVLVNNIGMSYFRHLRIRKLEPAPPPPAPVASTTPAMPAVVPAPPSPADPLPPGWTDLLAQADPAQGAVAGQWQKGPDGLVVKAQAGVMPFDLNQIPPEQYDFEMDFTVHSSEPDVAHILPLQGGPGWFIARLTYANCYLGQLLDGQQPSEQREAYTSDAKLAQSRRHRSLVQIRKDSVRLLLDGKEVMVFHGDLKRLTSDVQFALRNPAHLGIASHQAEVTFHRIGFRPHDPSRMDKADKDTLLATNPRLAQLDAGFQTRYQADAEKPFLAALAKLNQSYAANGIPKARAAAQAKGSLADVTALDAEKVRLEKKEGVPAEDATDTPEALKSLRQTYRAALAKLTAERDAKAAPLYAIYLKALDEHITALTKAGKLTEATTAQTWRDHIAAQKPATATVAAAAAPAAVKTTPATASKAAAGGGSTWRRAAEYLVTHGGSFVALKNGVPSTVTKESDIPPGKFDLIELTIDHLNSAHPKPQEEEFQVFNGLRDLRRVWIRIPGIEVKDSAYAWLAENNDLDWLNFESAGQIGDGVLAHLVGAKKLLNFQVQYSPTFTGVGMDKMPFAPTLTSADFLSTGLTDEGLRALSTMKKLTFVRISNCHVTDAGFAGFSGHKALVNLDAFNTGLGDASAAVLATMPQLTTLNLGGCKLTDEGLAKLRVLKNLTSLTLSGTAVTAGAAEAFQKDLPSCRVSR